MMYKVLLASVFLTSMFFLGCSKSSDTTTSTPAYVKPAFRDTLIVVPPAMESYTYDNNMYGAMSYGLIQGMNVYGFYGSIFYDVANENDLKATKNSDGSITYTWYSYGGVSLNMVYSSSNGTSSWTYEVDSAGHKYNICKDTETSSGGTFIWYQDENNTKGAEYTWTISNQVNTATLKTYKSDGTTVEGQWDAVSNPDKSGTLNIKVLNSNDVLAYGYQITWDSTGHGTFKSIDPDNGAILSNETF